MALFIHLLCAFGSVAYTTYVFFYPSRTGLKGTYALVALTLVSGSVLVFINPAHIANVCVTGLVYIGGISYAIVATRNKLARVTNTETTSWTTPRK